jgi:hypothetical protein
MISGFSNSSGINGTFPHLCVGASTNLHKGQNCHLEVGKLGRFYTETPSKLRRQGIKYGKICDN